MIISHRAATFWKRRIVAFEIRYGSIVRAQTRCYSASVQDIGQTEYNKRTGPCFPTRFLPRQHQPLNLPRHDAGGEVQRVFVVSDSVERGGETVGLDGCDLVDIRGDFAEGLVGDGGFGGGEDVPDGDGVSGGVFICEEPFEAIHCCRRYICRTDIKT